MRRTIRILLLALGLIGAAPLAEMRSTMPGARPAQPAFVEGEAMVKFKATASPQARARSWQSLSAAKTRDLPGGWAHVRAAPGMSTAAVVQAMARDPAVEYAQPNYYYYSTRVPNDPSYGQLWGLNNVGQTISNAVYSTSNPGTPGAHVDAQLAWDHVTDCSSVVVAVLDQGINYTHLDLAANMWNGGVPFPNHGWDFVDDDSDPMPTTGGEQHGTHVAGTIAAVGNNGIGSAGVCWKAAIMSVRVLNATGGNTAGIMQGIRFASDNGAKVINMSLGVGPGAGFDLAFSDAITYAQNHDVVVIAAAGNDANDNDSVGGAVYPCNFTQSNLVCVAALDQANALATFSNWGATKVHVGAPGTNILSSLPGPELSDNLGGWVTPPSTSGSPWTVSLCPFGSTQILMLLNPGGNFFCGGSNLYPNNTNAVAFKSFNLSGLRAATFSYFAGYDLENNLDFVTVHALGTGGNPQGGTQIGSFTGRTSSDGVNYFAVLQEHDLPSSCLTATCSIGFRMVSNGTVTSLGTAVLFPLISTVRNNANDYGLNNGTSMAAPHVSGVAALVRAFNSNYTYQDVVNAIKNGGVPVASLAGKTTTGRAANAMGSLAYIDPPTGVAAVLQSQ